MNADSDDVNDGSTPPMPSAPPPEHRPPKWAWWVVGIVVPLVPVAVALWPSSGPEAPADAAPAEAASASASAPPRENAESTTSPSTEAPAPSASLPDTPARIQHTGSVRIAESGPQLDEVPPKIDASSGDVHLGLVEPPRLFTGSDAEKELAEWSGRKMPTRQECADLVSTQGVSMMEVKKGTVVCVETRDGRTAVLTITSTSNSFNTGVMAQATVWSETAD